MALPETDLHRARLWASERVPEHLWDQVKVEIDESDRHFDIVEVRPPWAGVSDPTRFPIARLRFTKTSGLWAIYLRDRNLQFHEYLRKRPCKNPSVVDRLHRDLRGPDLLGLRFEPVRKGSAGMSILSDSDQRGHLRSSPRCRSSSSSRGPSLHRAGVRRPVGADVASLAD